MQFQTKNIDAEYFYDTVWRDFARWVIFTSQLRNPWQTLAEPLGSAEPRLKITAEGTTSGWRKLLLSAVATTVGYCFQHRRYVFCLFFFVSTVMSKPLDLALGDFAHTCTSTTARILLSKLKVIS